MAIDGKKKFCREHWEMLTWMHTHEASLDEKYDLQHAPRRKRKKSRNQKTSREPEAVLDLHGLTVEEASREIKSFVYSSKVKGYYLIKIIHGKGLHSLGEAKLKALVEEYLNGEGKKFISSWNKASVNHGGEGAVMIFL